MNYSNLDLNTLKTLLEREIELYNERNPQDKIEIYEVRNALNSMFSKEEVLSFIEELKSR